MENNELGEIKKILKQNAEAIDCIQTRLQKIEKYMRWQRSWAILKVLIIAVPIILSIIYLPPLFRDALEGYKELIGSGSYENFKL